MGARRRTTSIAKTSKRSRYRHRTTQGRLRDKCPGDRDRSSWHPIDTDTDRRDQGIRAASRRRRAARSAFQNLPPATRPAPLGAIHTEAWRSPTGGKTRRTTPATTAAAPTPRSTAPAPYSVDEVERRSARSPSLGAELALLWTEAAYPMNAAPPMATTAPAMESTIPVIRFPL